MMLRFRHKCTLHYLPVYTPNHAEKSDAKLFCRNVRSQIAEYSGKPILDTCFEDCRLMERFRAKYKGYPGYAFCEISRLYATYGKSYGEIVQVFDEYMENFKEIIDQRTGRCKLVDYVRVSGLDEKFLRNVYFNGLIESDETVLSIKNNVEAALRMYNGSEQDSNNNCLKV